LTLSFDHFEEVWLIDFEFRKSQEKHQEIICFCAKEYHSGKKIKLWLDQLDKPPFRLDDKVCFVSYMSSAEMRSFISLGWPLPKNNIDFYAVFKNITNGKLGMGKKGLLEALQFFGIPSISTAHKDAMRDRILEGPPFTEDERKSILEYCFSDVIALEKLLPKLEPYIFQTENHFGRYWIMGEYFKAAAHVETVGIPIDVPNYRLFQKYKHKIVGELLTEVDKEYQIYEDGVFKIKNFEDYLKKLNIRWDRTETGRLKTDDQTFRDMSKIYPELNPLREFRSFQSQVKQSGINIGEDGNNRTPLFPYSTLTSRNAPKAKESIISAAVWQRAYIKPKEGQALLYLDWSSQEYGIAAALSKDPKMIEAYNSGDPYISFGRDAGLIPRDATKQSHPKEREIFKQCVLAIGYGMGPQSLSTRINKPQGYAKDLLDKYARTYSRFWAWSQAIMDKARCYGDLWTTYGWLLKDGQHHKINTLRNWIMQSNGADMLRLATIFLVQEGIQVCMLIHDGIMVQAKLDEVEQVSKRTADLMAEASKLILNGFELRTDCKTIKYPDRYMDERGKEFWKKLNLRIAEQVEIDELQKIHTAV
jgi:DNA polymerase I